eukprot:3518029-Amphidinium_carterae.1
MVSFSPDSGQLCRRPMRRKLTDLALAKDSAEGILETKERPHWYSSAPHQILRTSKKSIGSNAASWDALTK